MLSVKILIPIVVFGFSVMFPLSQSHAQVAIPGWAEWLAGNVASSAAQNELMKVFEELKINSSNRPDGFVLYQKALKKYEKKLKKMKKKNDKARMKEEKQLQRIIDDMKSYTPGDPNVNTKQEKKQQRANKYLQKFQKNDRLRMEKIKKFIAEKRPEIGDFINTM